MGLLQLAKAFLQGYQAAAPPLKPKMTPLEVFNLGFNMRQTASHNWAEQKKTMKSNVKVGIVNMSKNLQSHGGNLQANMAANMKGMAKESQSGSVTLPTFQLPPQPKIKIPKMF